jgi:hypothetical protein
MRPRRPRRLLRALTPPKLGARPAASVGLDNDAVAWSVEARSEVARVGGDKARPGGEMFGVWNEARVELFS